MGEHPYRVHLQNVVNVSSQINHTEDVIITAWLHDVVEDTKVEIGDIPENYRPHIQLLSRNLSQGGLTYMEYIQRVAASDDDVAKTVKLADNIVNWSLSRSSGSTLASRYEKSMNVLLPIVFDDVDGWVIVERLSQSILL